MLDIVGLQIPNPGDISDPEEASQFGDLRLFTKELSEQELDKAALFSGDIVTEHNDSSILDSLTPLDVRVLVTAEEELSQTKLWSRLLPSSTQLPLSPSYCDRVVGAWEQEYSDCREQGRERLAELCRIGIHLQLPHTR